MRTALSLLVVASALSGFVTPSAAAPLPIRNASLSIRISSVAEFEIPRAPGPAIFTANGTRTGSQVLQLAWPQGIFALSTTATPVDVELVGGLGLSDVRNGVASFAAGGGGFAGTMAIRGYAWVCLLTCEFNPFPDQAISLPLDVVGVGGSELGDFGAVEVTLIGNPWTTGQAVVGADSETGSMGPAPGGGGFLAVRMVTPISIATNLAPPNQLIPAFGILAFEVPEPETLGLGLAAAGTLVAVGLARRRG